MIYFECSVGYIEGATSPAFYENKNVSDVTILDSKRYLSIITNYVKTFPSGNKTVGEFIDAATESFGNDYYKIWLLPAQNKDQYTGSAYKNGWIPSAPFMYPNTWKYREDSTDRLYFIVILPKLKKAFTNGRFYTIEDNGNLIISGLRESPYFTQQHFKYPVITNYLPGMNLNNAEIVFFAGNVNSATGTRNSYVGIEGNTDRLMLDMMQWLLSSNPTPDVLENDPYTQGGTSGPGGGDGTFDFTSTDIPIPGLPNISSSDTGFISLYNPSSVELKSLANYMWSGAFDLDNFKKLFADPMDVILGCHIIPTIAGHPAVEVANLVVGNLSTGLSMPRCTEQYYELDCGTVEIKPKWGAYLDFSPYTKLSLYLPYIGVVPISPDDCMNGSIKVVYHIDILSGSCCAFVYCTSNGGTNPHTLYTFNGNCNCPVPITSGQYGNALLATAQVGLGSLKIASSIATGAIGMGASGIQDVNSALMSLVKPEVSRSGEIGRSAGLMGIQYPYLILTVPKMCIPGQQNTYIGYPSFITMDMSALSGYTRIDVSHLNNMTCTEAETTEIIELLGSGVIF